MALAACGSGPTAPVGDQTPFDFAFEDPRGDTLAVLDLPPNAGPAVDLISVSGTVGADLVTLILDFAEPVSLWTSAAANSLDGFVDFDLDQASGTGGQDAAGGQFGLGVEFYLDLRDNGGGRMGLVDVTKKTFTTVPATFDGTRVTIEIPRSAFGTDDGQMNIGVLIGDRDRPQTDFGPDTSHYILARP
jgi:hypothetical protein